MTCPVCKKEMNAFPMGEKNGYKFVACRSCGSVMTDPLVKQSDLETFYGDVQPEVVHRPDPAAEIARAKKTIQRVAGPAGNNRRFLDISSRQGYAVMAAKELGFKAHGIDAFDFFTTFSQKEYGEEFFSPSTAAAYTEQADVIYAQDAFCEQTDLDGLAAALSRLLAPNGVIYIQEPDGNSLHLPRNFPSWPYAEPPINFIYLSQKGMKALLARHGLKIKKSFFAWGPVMQLVVGKA